MGGMERMGKKTGRRWGEGESEGGRGKEVIREGD